MTEPGELIDLTRRTEDDLVRAITTLSAKDPRYAENFPSWVQLEIEARHANARHNHRMEWAGLACGFVVTMTVLWLSYSLIINGYGVAGTVLGSVDLIALTALFITRRRPDGP